MQWSPDFDTKIDFLTAKDLVQEMKICSQEIPLPARNLLLSQSEFF